MIKNFEIRFSVRSFSQQQRAHSLSLALRSDGRTEKGECARIFLKYPEDNYGGVRKKREHHFCSSVR